MITTFDGFYLEVKHTNKVVYGFPIYYYKVITPTNVIFETDGFKPSLGVIWNPIQLPIEILQGVCLPYMGNDPEVFSNYTPEQLEWAKSDEIENYSLTMDDAEEYINNENYALIFEDDTLMVFKIQNIDSHLVLLRQPDVLEMLNVDTEFIS